MDKKPDPARLARAIKKERLAQGRTQQQAAITGGISPLTWLVAERGTRVPRSRTLRAIDSGLGWPAGTADRVLHGTRPPRVGSGEPEPTVPGTLSAIIARIEALEATIAGHPRPTN